VAGLASFTDLKLDERGSGYTMLVTSGSLSGATSAAFAVVAPMILDGLSAGAQFTCGFDGGGFVHCWGNNALGQLGDGTLVNRTLPGPIAIPASVPREQFFKVSAGETHACAATPQGVAYCWGDNLNGKLGDGTEGNVRTTPVLVAGGLSFVAVSAGGNHSCGLTTFPNLLYCWGANNGGQIGDGSQTFRTTPTLVAGGLTFASWSTGNSHTCGVTQNGAYCWGLNNRGQLGTGNTTDAHVPTAVSGSIAFTAVSAGGVHTCGVTDTGAAYCWGDNGFGQLGDGTVTRRTSPMLVAGGLFFSGISAGFEHTCGLTGTQAIYCWGRNADGQLGLGTTSIMETTPKPVLGGLNPTGVFSGHFHTCAQTFGDSYCWGGNAFGELGNGFTVGSSVPVRIVH
jgi:alpha-tubulin suppressor-like RCC1 family protein